MGNTSHIFYIISVLYNFSWRYISGIGGELLKQLRLRIRVVVRWA
jgi:hypothetical protein